jgi:two-component system chemotaxis response regulator CheY
LVRQAEYGSQKLRPLKQAPFAIAVIDWDLGGMDACAEIHAVHRLDDPANRALPIVLLSAVAQRPAIDPAMAAGAASCSVKPVAPAVLAQRLSAAIRSAKDFVETPSFIGPCRRRAAKAGYAGPWRRAANKAILIEWEGGARDPRAAFYRRVPVYRRVPPCTAVYRRVPVYRRARISLDGLLLRLARLQERGPNALIQLQRAVQEVQMCARLPQNKRTGCLIAARRS